MMQNSAAYAPEPELPGLAFSRPGVLWRNLLIAAVWLVIAGNGAVIVWLWWNGGNVTGITASFALFNSIGRITGLLSAYSALLQVLLLSRLPFLERVAGFDRLTVWHRRNGKICLYLVLAHVIFIIIGYSLMDGYSYLHEASVMILTYPGMVAAAVGTALFVVVVVSSLVIARRRLPYEAWYAVHFTVYGAIALAWFHQIPTGNELVLNQAAARYWESLYLVTLGVLVLFRLLLPAARAFWFDLRVAEVIPEGPGVVSIRLEGRHLDRLRVRPGQFFLWRFLSRGRWWQPHPFSLSAAPDGRSLRITVKNLGTFSGRLGSVKPGTRVVAEGPFGRFTEEARQRDRILLVAGGIGITPIRALLETICGDVALIYRVLRESDLIFRAEIERLAATRGVRVSYVVGDHRAPGGERLLSPEHLHQLVPDIAEREVFACGPPAMVAAIEHNLRAAGVSRRHLHIERFAL